MNENKICFILYCGDHMKHSDALVYIQELNVPENMQIECLTVESNENRYDAFNEGMYSSNAKYKVYMDFNNYILNKNIIYDIMEIFHSDDKIGILGIAGKKNTACINAGTAEYGKKLMDYFDFGLRMENFREVEDFVEIVDTLANTLVITAYDFPWDKENEIDLDGCITLHCKKFMQEGYKVGVVRQNMPWCLKEEITYTA